MKKLIFILIPVLILAAIVGPQLLFIVDETKVAIVTRFGDPQRSITSPGLYVKTPFIDKTTFFEKRLLIFDAAADSLLTEDKRRLVIDVYARGRIVDPLLFFETVRDETRARNRAIEIIASELRREIALDLQAEVIATSREDIMLRVRDSVNPKLRELGISVVDVRIKRADFPDEIADSIHERMRAERKRKADRERAQGAEKDLEIRAATDKDATILLAEAERKANITRGEGEASAIAIFADALEQDPEFYAFQRSLEAYKVFLKTNTTVVLPANSDLFQFLTSPFGKDE